jgi:hypothetical protein
MHPTFRRALALVACGITLLTSHAHAQDGASANITWLDVPPGMLDTDAIIARVHERTSIALDAAPSDRVLVVQMRDRDAIDITLDGPGAAHLERSAALPDDATERTETVAILLSNLLLDESAELLAMLRPAEAEEESDPDTAPAPDPDPDPDPDTDPDTDPDPDPDPAPAPDPDPAPGPTPRQPIDLRVAVAGHLGSVPRGTGSEVDLLYGFELSWAPPDLIALGVRDLAFSGLPNDAGIRLDAAPIIELRFTESFFSLYGQLGAHIQLAFLTDSATQRAGVAPLLVGGVRFRIAREFSIGIETAFRVIATEQFTTALHDLPQLAVPWTGGLAAVFHL